MYCENGIIEIIISIINCNVQIAFQNQIKITELILTLSTEWATLLSNSQIGVFSASPGW